MKFCVAPPFAETITAPEEEGAVTALSEISVNVLAAFTTEIPYDTAVELTPVWY